MSREHTLNPFLEGAQSPKPWLLVPAKPFAEGKTRLADTLAEHQRVALNRWLLHHVLQIAIQSQCFTQILVVSRGQDVLQLAREHNVQILVEAHHNHAIQTQHHQAANHIADNDSLNIALEQARSHAIEAGATAILVLPADLPRLNQTDLVQLCTAADELNSERGMVIAPSHDGGTNALWLQPPQAIPFAYGLNSFAQHCRLAEQANIPYTIVDSPTLAFDLDWPDDLEGLEMGLFL
ncbi:MAG: DUF2064 domain-containing protein [Chloroflexota bacterium]